MLLLHQDQIKNYASVRRTAVVCSREFSLFSIFFDFVTISHLDPTSTPISRPSISYAIIIASVYINSSEGTVYNRIITAAPRTAHTGPEAVAAGEKGDSALVKQLRR